MSLGFHAAVARSFSLVEILVATAVLSILCLVLVEIVDNTSRAWRGQEAKQEGLREAAAAFNVITRDLRNAVVSTNAAWFYSSPTNVAFLASLPKNAQDSSELSDICVVGYGLEWGAANSADAHERNRMALYRYVRFSNATYSTVLTGGKTLDDVFASPDGTNTVREVLARNVPQFSWNAYSLDVSNTPIAYLPADGTNAFPRILDFTISTLNEAVAAKLTARAQWTDTNSPLIRQNRETYNLRVRPGGS